MPYLMLFGRHKGKPITEVPDKDLLYYLGWDQCRPETKAEIEKELARRRGGDGPATGHGKTVAATGKGTNAAIYERALDIVAAGGAALAGRPHTVEAVAWLQDATAGGPAPDTDAVPF